MLSAGADLVSALLALSKSVAAASFTHCSYADQGPPLFDIDDWNGVSHKAFEKHSRHVTVICPSIYRRTFLKTSLPCSQAWLVPFGL